MSRYTNYVGGTRYVTTLNDESRYFIMDDTSMTTLTSYSIATVISSGELSKMTYTNSWEFASSIIIGVNLDANNCKSSTGQVINTYYSTWNLYSTWTASHKNSSQNGLAYLSTSYKVE